MHKECYYCHCQTKEKLIDKFGLSINDTEKFSSQVDNFIQHNWHLSNPLIATHIHRIAKKQIGVDDLYEKEKKTANKIILKNYNYWKQLVNNSDNPFHTAAKLAVIGNIIDYGAHSVPDQIELFIEKQRSIELAIDDTSKLFDAIQKANSIFYIGDNAGEIVFDKLFIETIGHPNIQFAVRDEPVINDVTLKEALAVGINDYCHVISNGNDSPSTLLELCSPDFINAFENADVVISKGQGNYEGLLDVKKKNLFFLLMAKCNPIAEMIGVQKGDMVIKQQN